MSRVRVCFLGTPDFAVTALKALLSDSHYEVVGIVTQPDRPSGRKLQLTPSPVKTLGISKNIPVLSPESLRTNPLIIDEIRLWKAEVAVVVAFGQILTEEFLQMFPFGAVNIHGSLLPLWRGAAPIQRSLEAGDTETGVALQKVVKKLDAGDILGFRKVTLNQTIHADELYTQLAELGADLLHVELMDYVRGNLAGTPQDETKVTVAKKIDKSEAEIHWDMSAEKIHNKVRAFAMGPGTWTLFAGKKIKLHKTFFDNGKTSDVKPGTIINVLENELQVQAGSGILKIYELQPESRNRMSVQDFLKSHPVKKNDFFGEEL